jgi:hypothetical protein
MPAKTKTIDLDVKELDALIKRLEEAIEHNLALSTEDIRLVLQAVKTLASMQERLSTNDVTVHKLRKLVGMIQSSEKLASLLGEKTKPTQPKKKPITRKKKPKNKKTIEPLKVHHAQTQYSRGDSCPSCLTGTLYKYNPAEFLRITGHTPYSPERHILERLRCNACGEFFTAPLPDDVAKDGQRSQKYGYSARSLMALNKYFAGSPFYRQESMQDLLGFSISASTIFDQCEYLGNDLNPIYQAMITLSANAEHFYLDDTTHRVLTQQPIEKKKRNSDKMQIRTGLYASGIIATHKDKNCVLFQTNIGHAGEFIDELLAQRTSGLAPPILMSDALSSNNPQQLPVLHAACNAHARRQFVDVMEQFPSEVEWVLKRYKVIWKNDDHVIEQALSPAECLAYHKLHSLPVMESIYQWGEQHFSDETVEENSVLGKAIRYFLRHFDRLTLFCQIEGAKIDNNKMEAMLKLIVRNRKNSFFYKTPAGAAISDVITSCIATAMVNEVNAFDYFNIIQRYSEQVKKAPQLWLPWNYTQNNLK